MPDVNVKVAFCVRCDDVRDDGIGEVSGEGSPNVVCEGRWGANVEGGLGKADFEGRLKV